MTLFEISFVIFWLGSVSYDYMRFKDTRKRKVNKTLYICINAFTLGLLIAHILNIRVIMPTQLVVRIFAPYVKSLFGGLFNA